MGNPSWGNGYHQGSVDGYNTGFNEGAKTGGIIGSVITLAVVGIGTLGVWGYNKVRTLRIKKHEQGLSAEEILPTDEKNEDDEDKIIE